MIGNPGNAAVFTMRHPLPHSKTFSAAQEKSAGGKKYLRRLLPPRTKSIRRKAYILPKLVVFFQSFAEV